MLAPSQRRSDYLATVTDIEEIDSELFAVRCRLHDGGVRVIVIPKGLVTVDRVLLTVQAVMDITRIRKAAP